MKSAQLSTTDGGYSVRAAERVLDILDVLQNAPEGISLAAVASGTQLPKSSVFRYLATLEARGYVERVDGEGNYRLGLAFLPLRARHVDRLAARARPLLEELSIRFQETVNLGVLDRTRVEYVEIVESPLTMRLAARRGDRDPIHSTALGKAIAAQLREDDVRRILDAEGMPRLTSKTITDADAYIAALEQVRTRGYAVDGGENEEDARCVAVAIALTPVPAAISLSAPAVRFSLDRVDEVAAALLRTAGSLAASSEAPSA